MGGKEVFLVCFLIPYKINAVHIMVVAVLSLWFFFVNLLVFLHIYGAIMYGFLFVMGVERGGVLLFSLCRVIVVAIVCAIPIEQVRVRWRMRSCCTTTSRFLCCSLVLGALWENGSR